MPENPAWAFCSTALQSGTISVSSAALTHSDKNIMLFKNEKRIMCGGGMQSPMRSSILKKLFKKIQIILNKINIEMNTNVHIMNHELFFKIII